MQRTASSTTTLLQQLLHAHGSASAAAGAAAHGALAALALQQQSRHRSSMPDSIKAAFGYCVSEVKQHDYRNYVWIAQLPKELRPALFALRAFNVETALVADQVKSKEAPLVALRFQWWRDAVAAAFDGRPPQQPVALALAHVLSHMHEQALSSPSPSSPSGSTSLGEGRTAAPKLTRYPFKRILDAREADVLDNQPPLDLAALEQYAESTAAQLLYLQLGAAGVRSKEADHAASHLGRAVGIATLLQGSAVHAAGRRSYLPVELCAQHKVSQEDVYSGVATDGLRDVVHSVASLAKGHLDEARRLQPSLPKQACAVMLQGVACGQYLEALEAANFDPFQQVLLQGGSSPLRYVLAVKYHQLCGTF